MNHLHRITLHMLLDEKSSERFQRVQDGAVEAHIALEQGGRGIVATTATLSIAAVHLDNKGQPVRYKPSLSLDDVLKQECIHE